MKQSYQKLVFRSEWLQPRLCAANPAPPKFPIIRSDTYPIPRLKIASPSYTIGARLMLMTWPALGASTGALMVP